MAVGLNQIWLFCATGGSKRTTSRTGDLIISVFVLFFTKGSGVAPLPPPLMRNAPNNSLFLEVIAVTLACPGSELSVSPPRWKTLGEGNEDSRIHQKVSGVRQGRDATFRGNHKGGRVVTAESASKGYFWPFLAPRPLLPSTPCDVILSLEPDEILCKDMIWVLSMFGYITTAEVSHGSVVLFLGWKHCCASSSLLSQFSA